MRAMTGMIFLIEVKESGRILNDDVDMETRSQKT